MYKKKLNLPHILKGQIKRKHQSQMRWRLIQKAPILQEKNQLKVDESKLVDAVIWSEILGPPRAKNPYFRNKAQRK